MKEERPMIYCYQDRKGDLPIIEWLEEVAHQEKSTYQKMLHTLSQMQEKKLPLERPLVKKTPKQRTGYNNVYKMRLGNYRLFFQVEQQDYYLLHAFYKKTQATPEKEFRQVKKEIKAQSFVEIPKKIIKLIEA